MKASEMYLVLNKTVAILANPKRTNKAVDDCAAELAVLRDKLAPKRGTRVLLVVVAADGKTEKTVGPMTMKKAQEKAEFFATLGMFTRFDPAPVVPRKPREKKAKA